MELKGTGNLCCINGLDRGQWWNEWQHHLGQPALSASLTPRQRQRREGNAEEETAPAVRQGTPDLKHPWGHSSLRYLFSSAWTTPAAHMFKTLDHLGGAFWDSVCQCLSCTVKKRSIRFSLLTCEEVFKFGKNKQTKTNKQVLLFISIQQMLLYLKTIFGLYERFRSFLLQWGAFRLWL